ncbi:TIPIN [Acanthosepion pharaonis]|uniref:TIMELESS-interacting protein n=1 Tax=Acanthosepion pharaonis TaxID=158019 RepID=A0A812BH30_ACAPH|nr:TIPIN [Sepia pharaonis]
MSICERKILYTTFISELSKQNGNNPEDVGAEQNPVESTENQEEENTFDASMSAKLAKGAAKKVVRNPQPKLDPQRLSSERGIAILPKLFENVKFKGKGYEAQDLEKVIKGLEHWAHRLFPKRTFDECLQTIEKLGNRREVKTCIKKIRLDMPVLDEDFVSKPEEVIRNSEDIGDLDEITEAEHAFDKMMQTPTSSQFTSLSSSPGNLLPSSQPNCSSKSKTVSQTLSNTCSYIFHNYLKGLFWKTEKTNVRSNHNMHRTT